MDILSFLKKSEGKNIFIFDGNNKIAINSYKSELVSHLKSAYDVEIKYYEANESPKIIIDQFESASCFGRTLIISANNKLPFDRLKRLENLENSLLSFLNFLIIECDGKCDAKFSKLKNAQYILLQKKQDIFADLIRYYIKKYSVFIEDSAIKVLINYFFTNDFSIENEIIKLKLYFYDKNFKNLISYIDVSNFINNESYSINKLFQSLIYSDMRAFLKEIDNFTEDEYMLLIRSLLRNFNIIAEYLIKLQNGCGKELAIIEAKKLNFYDDRALNYIATQEISIATIRKILKSLMDLEKYYKISVTEKKSILMHGLIGIYIIIKNSKRKP